MQPAPGRFLSLFKVRNYSKVLNIIKTHFIHKVIIWSYTVLIGTWSCDDFCRTFSNRLLSFSYVGIKEFSLITNELQVDNFILLFSFLLVTIIWRKSESNSTRSMDWVSLHIFFSLQCTRKMYHCGCIILIYTIYIVLKTSLRKTQLSVYLLNFKADCLQLLTAAVLNVSFIFNQSFLN